MRTIVAIPFLLALLAAPALAAEEGRPASVAFRLDAAVFHRSFADLSGGGGFRATRLDVEPGLDLFFSRSFGASLGLGFSHHRYEFEGTEGVDPWGAVESFRLSAFARWALDDRWTLFGGPSLRFAAERSADLADGASVGGFAGAAFAVSETLRIGPGVGAFTEIEDSAVVFPFLLVDWEFAPDWSLSTGRGPGATRGPGLTVEWSFADDFSVALGARWEELRFRRDDDGAPASGGVGEDESFPVILELAWRPAPRTRVSLFAGTSFGGRLRLIDRSGRELADRDYDPALFLGVALSLPF